MVFCRPEETSALHHSVFRLGHALLPHIDLLHVLQLEARVRGGGGDAGAGVALFKQTLQLTRSCLDVVLWATIRQH